MLINDGCISLMMQLLVLRFTIMHLNASDNTVGRFAIIAPRCNAMRDTDLVKDCC